MSTSPAPSASSGGAPARLVGLRRVSTNGQVEHGFGLDVQSAMLRMGAQKLRAQLVAICTDAGDSGKGEAVDSRAGLLEALSMIRDEEGLGLLVPRLDRLARDLILQEQLIAEVRRLGGEVWSCAPGEDAFLRDDAADPSRRLIRQVLGAVAEYERSMIRLRLEAGRNRKRASGGYAGHGAPPFGFKSVEGVLVPVPEQQAIIARARELKESGLTLRAIGAVLEKEGLPGPRGPRWHLGALQRILR